MAAILADDILKRIFLNENVRISMQISLKFVPYGPIDNKSALVQVMAWRRTGDKPLPEAMMTQFTDAYICDTRGRWVNQIKPQKSTNSFNYITRENNFYRWCDCNIRFIIIILEILVIKKGIRTNVFFCRKRQNHIEPPRITYKFETE